MIWSSTHTHTHAHTHTHTHTHLGTVALAAVLVDLVLVDLVLTVRTVGGVGKGRLAEGEESYAQNNTRHDQRQLLPAPASKCAARNPTTAARGCHSCPGKQETTTTTTTPQSQNALTPTTHPHAHKNNKRAHSPKKRTQASYVCFTHSPQPKSTHTHTTTKKKKRMNGSTLQGHVVHFKQTIAAFLVWIFVVWCFVVGRLLLLSFRLLFLLCGCVWKKVHACECVSE